MHGHRRPGRLVRGLLLAALLAAAACGGGTDRAARIESEPRGGSRDGAGPTSIVQLGDSIASGEGTLYGYTYDTTSREWTGGNLDVTWPGPYPECHDSPDAYGQVIATQFKATFTQFACTGATFANGISAPEVSDGTTDRPAEFGNWDDQTDLNAEYDAAKPDLVLITLGADDVQFSSIVEECIKNGYEYYFDLADLECTEANPGSTIETDFTDFLPTLEKNYGTLVDWIEARAKQNDVPVPKIVFTNYADPLPDPDVQCPDISYLYDQQVTYLSSLVQQMNETITSTIEGLKNANIAVADISHVYQPADVDHRFCSDAPWAYGLSIYHLTDPDSFESQAPFHPTPDGQEAIAEHVTPAILQLFKADLP
jgi:lysophospholipase L1-like esterase